MRSSPAFFLLALADSPILAGYEAQLKTYRLNMADLYPLTPTTPSSMLLDGVGGCATLVKAALHRAGAIFPAWPVEHQLETEGFAQIAKKLGGKLVGLPGYYVYHGASSLFLAELLLTEFRRTVRVGIRGIDAH